MKNRKEVPTLFPDITKILIKDNQSGKWVEPKFGKKFKARKYVLSEKGRIRIKRSFKTIAEAKAFRLSKDRDSELAREARNTALGTGKGQLTFGALFEIWKRDWLPLKDISTQLKYLNYTKHFRFLWNSVVDDLEPTHIDQWLGHLKKPEYLAQCHSSRCNYEHEFKALRVILNFYRSRFNRNFRSPFIQDHLEMLKVKAKPEVRKDLTVEQFQDFIKALKELCWGTKWEVIYYLALMQYAIYGRLQEAAALSVESFDFGRNELSITQKVQWLKSKTHPDRVVPGGKTNRGKILNPIPELAAQIFREWVMRSGIRSGLLFLMDGRLMSYRQIESKYTEALKVAKLPFRATHILRHASLTEAYDSCKDLLLVQRLAGQKDLRATTRYAKVRDTQLKEIQKKMDEKLSSILIRKK